MIDFNHSPESFNTTICTSINFKLNFWFFQNFGRFLWNVFFLQSRWKMLSIKICSIRFLRCDTILSTFSPFVFVCTLSLYLFSFSPFIHLSLFLLILLSLLLFLSPSYLLLFVFLFFSLPSSLSIFFSLSTPFNLCLFILFYVSCLLFFTSHCLCLSAYYTSLVLALFFPHYHFYNSILSVWSLNFINNISSPSSLWIVHYLCCH